MEQTENIKTEKKRLLFLDALRGFDMFWIVGGEGVVHALAVLTGMPLLLSCSKQLRHPAWNGFTAYDLIFPLFIFLSGMTLGIANRKLTDLPWEERKPFYKKSCWRLFILILLGVVYNHGRGRGIPTSFGEVRFASVLARIGVAWFFAAMIVWHTKFKTQLYIAIGILFGYWAMLYWIPVSGHGAGVITSEGCINAWVDSNLLPGRILGGRALDPEGILSSMPAIVNALIGCWCGRFIRFKSESVNDWHKAGIILASGFVLVGLGWIWNYGFPVNKNLWTSSFVLVTTGWSLVLTAVFYSFIDLLNWKVVKLSVMPWVVIGCNAIVIYLLSSIVDWHYCSRSIFGNLIYSVPKPYHTLLMALTVILLKLTLLTWMFRKKVFVRV